MPTRTREPAKDRILAAACRLFDARGWPRPPSCCSPRPCSPGPPRPVVRVVLLGLFGVSANSVLIHLPVRCAAPGSARRLKPRNLPYRTTFRNVRGQSADVTADSQERCR